jgi:hypothetical protein
MNGLGLKIRRYLVPWGFDSPSRHHLRDLKFLQASSLLGLFFFFSHIVNEKHGTADCRTPGHDRFAYSFSKPLCQLCADFSLNPSAIELLSTLLQCVS